MQQSPSLTFYLLVAAAMLGLVWLGWRLLNRWHPFYRQPQIRTLYWIVSAACLAAIPLIRYLRPLDGSYGLLFHIATYGVYIWLIGVIALLPVMAVLGGGRLMRRRLQPTAPEAGQSAMDRRTFLRKATVSLPLAAWGISAGGIVVGDNYIAAQRYTLAYEGLPAELDGFKVAQISDTHIGPFFDMAKMDRVLAMTAAEKPDVLVITGDLIDDLNLLAPAMERLSRFAPDVPKGVYFCWGNHEYFRGVSTIRRALEATPVQLLHNSNRQITNGVRPAFLLGVDYPWAKKGDDQQTVRQAFFRQAISGVPNNAFCLLLAHHPGFIDDGFDNNIPLTLTGHTHGGQVALGGYPLLPLQYKYMRGFYERGGHYGYVSLGTGHWLPFRLGSPAEVAFFNFKPASPQFSAGIWPNR